MKRFTQYLLLQYIIVCVILMILYQGGSLFAPKTLHYVFDQNYLSDLGRTTFFSGNNNPYWFVYSITLFLVGIGTFLFFYLTSKAVMQNRKMIIWFFALISALGYIGIAISPVDTHFKQHIISGQFAYFSFLFATLSLNFLMDRKNYRNIFIWLLLLNLLLIAFLSLSLFGPHSSEGIWALSLKTIAQKVMTVAQLGVSLLILRKITPI